MGKAGGVILGLVALVAIAFAVFMVDFDVTEDGALPDVDVSVDGGELPEVDAEVGEVEVGTATEEVEVPDVDVDVDTESAEVEVPTIDVNPPEDDS
ncbi:MULTISPECIES: hypothetical protein [Maritimibacter]|jgi:phage baseplate assembly protein gpV|uniref:Uncharacterized protein n=1 Tax=Maritimibacter alkaliphilus HTCC2654 TaxID=314271 RepID=A3VAV4_9RHOB|nr:MULTISPECIES: hypothetical protein [Maritimibacter]EAQ15045.1 hypothetical protein RB2654_20718 [Maritimibacter alkaliphilus HTCC2654]MBL6426451.1 hypothetical protein [Maritimibacter sp.]TYP80731.1 hypothetical protein BD830_10629 [Maritimibacter alkaliphilus HTCC2654]